GSSVSRGGETNGPAAIYALESYLGWLKRYAPAEAYGWEWTDAGPVCARGDIAQNIFQYITWLSDLRFHTPGSPVCDRTGLPLWRVAPIPHGRYWAEGMKVGYQDAGCWTIPSGTKGKKLAASWLWAQFCVSKTVALKKFIVAGTPIRKSTVFSDYLSEHKAEYGGLVEFYRSPEECRYTGSGRNVPHYSRMSPIWWKNISKAIRGEAAPEETMNRIAAEQDAVMMSLSQKAYSPKMNIASDPALWLDRPGKSPDDSPKKAREREKPLTVPYDELIARWEK
ncbi:MAG: carbohydrate ABC transporter substrate-binding protein, partial [Spirochaetota bacterium]